MFDETQIKIIDATMTIIVEKGYSGTTTKNIAKLAGVNECTIFRKFDGKKEIILAAMSLPKWNPNAPYSGNLMEKKRSFWRRCRFRGGIPVFQKRILLMSEFRKRIWFHFPEPI